jgi:hypothetical protein
MTAQTPRPRLRSVEAPAVKAALVEAAAAAEEAVVEKAVRRRGPAKTGNPATDRKANAAKAAKVAARRGGSGDLDASDYERDGADAAEEVATKAKATPKAPAAKAPAKPKADTRPKSRAMAPKLPTGYAVRWPKGAFNLAKKGDGAAADGPAWIVICTEHGTTTGAATTIEANLLGRKADRAGWCKGCAAAV